jgi:hypothetical protein
MKRWTCLILGILFFIGYAQDWTQTTPAKQKNKTNTLTNFVTRKYPPVPVAKSYRSPASKAQRNRVKRITDPSLLSKNPIRIGKSFQIVEGVSTMEKNKYKSSLGKKISENAQYVYFRPASGKTEAWPVALDSTNLRLYPISHVLHVKGVGPELRAQFKSEGLNEYYYHPRLKFMFLEASPSTVLQQFQKLTARGFDVRLEVIKETPRSR